jgi:hypothetical protein
MSYMKEIDRLANEIGDILVINPDTVNLSQVSGGWMADIYTSGQRIESEILDDPIKAMENLLCKTQKSRNEHSQLFF